jgi:PHD/YefM family antitoxin component YafN of YafNO toxin-antitoxin module
MYVKAYAMTTFTATEARKNIYSLVDEVNESHEAIQIQGKRGSAVLIAEDDWRALQETLYLSSIPGMKKSILKGMKTPVRKCSKKLAW